MDPQATDGPSQPHVPADPDEGTATRPLGAAGAGAKAPARRQDAKLSEDGQLVEAGYGHGV